MHIYRPICKAWPLLVLAVRGATAQLTTLDDTDSSITYDPPSLWLHDNNQGSPIFDGTISYSNFANATYSFSFTGTGFSIFVGPKVDRGRFVVVVDGVFLGTGDAWGPATGADPPQTPKQVFNVAGLVAAKHAVKIWQNKAADSRIPSTTAHAFIALDYIQFFAASPTTTLVSVSAAYPSNSQTGSIKDGVAVVSAGQATKTALIAGLVAGLGGTLLTLLAVGVGWFLWRRSRQRALRETAERPELDDVPDTGEYSTRLFSAYSTSYAPVPLTSSATHSVMDTDANHGFLPPSYNLASTPSNPPPEDRPLPVGARPKGHLNA